MSVHSRRVRRCVISWDMRDLWERRHHSPADLVSSWMARHVKAYLQCQTHECAPCLPMPFRPRPMYTVGEYMDGQSCNGMTFHDTQTCAVCGNGGAAYDCGSGTATGAACDGMTTVDTQTCSSSGGGSGDPPHFPNGGRAGFRGSHRACCVFVSSAGFNSLPFQEVDFLFTSPQGVRQLVHGTFMTSVFWRVRTSAGRELSYVGMPCTRPSWT